MKRRCRLDTAVSMAATWSNPCTPAGRTSVSDERIILQQVVQSDDVEIVRWGGEGVGLRHDGLNGCLKPSMHAGNSSAPGKAA